MIYLLFYLCNFYFDDIFCIYSRHNLQLEVELKFENLIENRVVSEQQKRGEIL